MNYFKYLILIVCLTGCSKTEPIVQPPYNSPLTLSQLMNWVLDPAADGIWDAVGWVSTAKGELAIAPKNEAQWDDLRNHAATLMEASNLLMLDKYAKDKNDWMLYANRLSKSAEATLEAINKRDIDAIFLTGSEIDTACEACHIKYGNFTEKSIAQNK